MPFGNEACVAVFTHILCDDIDASVLIGSNLITVIGEADRLETDISHQFSEFKVAWPHRVVQIVKINKHVAIHRAIASCAALDLVFATSATETDANNQTQTQNKPSIP